MDKIAVINAIIADMESPIRERSTWNDPSIYDMIVYYRNEIKKTCKTVLSKINKGQK